MAKKNKKKIKRARPADHPKAEGQEKLKPGSAASPLSKKNIVCMLLLVLISSLVYFNILDNDFVYDDTAVVLENVFIRDLANIKQLFSKAYFERSGVGQMTNSGEGSYRPVVTLSYFIDYAVWKMDPIGYHASNMMWHAGCIVLWFLFVLTLTRRRMIAFTAGCLAAVHPVMSEAVNAVAFREDLLAAFFYCAALYMFLLYINSGEKKFFAFSAASYLLALFSKEMAFFLPIVALATAWHVKKSESRARNISIGMILAGYAAVALFYFAIRFFVLVNPKVVHLAYPGGSVWTNFLTISAIFLDYLKLLVWPHPLCVDYTVDAVTSAADKRFLLALLVYSSLAALAIRSFLKNGFIWYPVLWFFVNLIPVSNFVKIKNIMAERYLYLPSFGFSLFAAILFIKMYSRLAPKIKMLSLCAMGGIVLIFGCLTVQRNKVWQDSYSLWTNTVSISPNSYNAHSNLAIALVDKKRYEEAAEEYKKALAIDPDDPEGHYNLARCWGLMGKKELSISHYRRSIEIDPSYSESHNNIGIIYAKDREFKKAIKEFEYSLSINSRSANAYNNIGNCYAELGEVDKSIRAFKKAIRLDPGKINAYTNIAGEYLQINKPREAEKYLQKAISIDPKNALAYLILSHCWRATGDITKEKEDLHKVLSLDPNHRDATKRLKEIERTSR